MPGSIRSASRGLMEAPGSSLLASPGREAGAAAPRELDQKKTHPSRSRGLQVSLRESLSAAPSRDQSGELLCGEPWVPAPWPAPRSALSLSWAPWAPSEVRAVKLMQAPRCPTDALAAACDCGDLGLGALLAASPSQAWVAGVLSRAAPHECRSRAAASIPGSPVGAAPVSLSERQLRLFICV